MIVQKSTSKVSQFTQILLDHSKHNSWTHISRLSYCLIINNGTIPKPTQSTTSLSWIKPEVILHKIFLLHQPTNCAPDWQENPFPSLQVMLSQSGFSKCTLTHNTVIEYPVVAYLDHMLPRTMECLRYITTLNPCEWPTQYIFV